MSRPQAAIVSLLPKSRALLRGISRHILKDREVNASQLNRLGWLTFIFASFRFQPATSAFRRRTVSVLLLSHPGSNDILTTLLVPVQVLTENWQLEALRGV